LSKIIRHLKSKCHTFVTDLNMNNMTTYLLIAFALTMIVTGIYFVTQATDQKEL
jgi:hypothetical protein